MIIFVFSRSCKQCWQCLFVATFMGNRIIELRVEWCDSETLEVTSGWGDERELLSGGTKKLFASVGSTTVDRDDNVSRPGPVVKGAGHAVNCVKFSGFTRDSRFTVSLDKHAFRRAPLHLEILPHLSVCIWFNEQLLIGDQTIHFLHFAWKGLTHELITHFEYLILQRGIEILCQILLGVLYFLLVLCVRNMLSFVHVAFVCDYAGTGPHGFVPVVRIKIDLAGTNDCSGASSNLLTWTTISRVFPVGNYNSFKVRQPFISWCKIFLSCNSSQQFATSHTHHPSLHFTKDTLKPKLLTI